MARYNEILVGRFNRGLQKLFGMKGEVPAPQLSSEVQPGVLFGDVVEHRYIESYNRYGNANAPTGIAGQVPAAQIRNPDGSNVVAVIESLTLSTSVADLVQMEIASGLGALATVQTSVRLDARQQVAQGNLVVSSTTSGNGLIAAASIFRLIQTLANGASQELILTENQELTLLPGDGIRWAMQVVAATMRSTLVWRERFLEESERA